MPYELPGVKLSNISHTSKEREVHESVETDHEYEMVDKYNRACEDIPVPQAPPPKLEQQQSSSAGDYGLTQCPAYVPVIHSNRQTKTSLMQPATLSSEGTAPIDQNDKQNESVYETA